MIEAIFLIALGVLLLIGAWLRRSVWWLAALLVLIALPLLLWGGFIALLFTACAVNGDCL